MQQSSNWNLKRVCSKLDLVNHGEVKRVSIFVENPKVPIKYQVDTGLI